MQMRANAVLVATLTLALTACGSGEDKASTVSLASDQAPSTKDSVAAQSGNFMDRVTPTKTPDYGHDFEETGPGPGKLEASGETPRYAGVPKPGDEVDLDFDGVKNGNGHYSPVEAAVANELGTSLSEIDQ